MSVHNGLVIAGRGRWRIAIGIIAVAQLIALAAAVFSLTDSREIYWGQNMDDFVMFGLLFLVLSIANLGLIVARILTDKS